MSKRSAKKRALARRDVERRPEAHREPWTPFQPATMPDLPPGFEDKHDAVWKNSRYTVVVYEMKTEMGPITQLSIKRNDREPMHDWRDLQRIKNEICGPQREAFELYPAEARVVDTANQYHLWVLPEGHLMPVGFFDGRVISEKESMGAKQRPFEDDARPADLIEFPENREDLQKMKPEMEARRQRMLDELMTPDRKILSRNS